MAPVPIKGIYLPGTGSITKDKRSMPLTSSKNLSKTNTDLCKMSVTDTHFYLNPLVLILKLDSHHAAPQKLGVRPAGSRTPQALHSSPKLRKVLIQLSAASPFRHPALQLFWAGCYSPNPACVFLLLPSRPADRSLPAELPPSLSPPSHLPVLPDPPASWTPLLTTLLCSYPNHATLF